MQIDGQGAALTCLCAIVVIGILAYTRLSAVLANTNQVLVVWEKVAETPILGAYVGQLCTYLLKIRNPYTRSIGSALTCLC
jgi:hypothetical protein